MYKFYNANAVGRFEDDCVIRALSCATNKSWDSVYDLLSDTAQAQGTMFDKRHFVISYLDEEYNRLPTYGLNVGEISALYDNKNIVITMVGHITCSKYGIIYDTFDCRDRKAEYVWEIV